MKTQTLIILCIFLFILLCTKYKDIFQNKNLPYNIWMYWENDKDNQMPDYISLCIDTVIKNSGDQFKIHLLNEKTIYEYLPNLRRDLSQKIPKISMKTDYLRFQLLYHYGGIWLDVDIIVLNGFNDLLKKLQQYDFVGFGCHNGQKCNHLKTGYPTPATWVMISRKHGVLMKEIIVELDKILNTNNANYFNNNYFILGRVLLWKCIKRLKETSNWNYYHIPSKCIERDNKLNKITNKRWLSKEDVDKNCDNTPFVVLYNTNPGFPKWFMKLSKKEILNNNYLISKFFRKALNYHL